MINNIVIEIDGPDKTGKDILHKYIEQLGNYAYTINSRGILTQLVYNDKFKRNQDYKLYYKPLIILLLVDELDHKIRCSLNKEPTINIQKDLNIYNAYSDYLEELDAAIILKFNTSEITPYNIGKKVIQYLNNIDEEDFFIAAPKIIKTLNLYTKEDLENEDVFYASLNI